MAELRIGLVGCGKQGEKHVAGLKKLPGVQVFVSDSEQDLARAFCDRHGTVYVADPVALTEDQSIDAIDIATPPQSHVSLIERALAAGKHYFCEKPLCLELTECEEVARLTERSGLVGMVGYVYRFAPAFELERSLVANRTGSSPIGQPVSGLFRIGGRGGHQPWKHSKADGGGAVNEMLVHMLDLAHWYFGPAREGQVLQHSLLRPERPVGGRVQRVDAEDFILVRIVMESGVELIVQADLVTPAFTQFCEVQGTNGTMVASIQADHPSFVFCSEPRSGYEAGKTLLDPAKVNLFDAQMREFVRAVGSRDPSVPRCTPRDSVELMRTLDLLQL